MHVTATRMPRGELEGCLVTCICHRVPWQCQETVLLWIPYPKQKIMVPAHIDFKTPDGTPCTGSVCRQRFPSARNSSARSQPRDTCPVTPVPHSKGLLVCQVHKTTGKTLVISSELQTLCYSQQLASSAGPQDLHRWCREGNTRDAVPSPAVTGAHGSKLLL